MSVYFQFNNCAGSRWSVRCCCSLKACSCACRWMKVIVSMALLACLHFDLISFSNSICSNVLIEKTKTHQKACFMWWLKKMMANEMNGFFYIFFPSLSPSPRTHFYALVPLLCFYRLSTFLHEPRRICCKHLQFTHLLF